MIKFSLWHIKFVTSCVTSDCLLQVGNWIDSSGVWKISYSANLNLEMICIFLCVYVYMGINISIYILVLR